MKGYESVHITQIRAGDVVFFDGKDRTVGAKDLKRDPPHGDHIMGRFLQLRLSPCLEKIMLNVEIEEIIEKAVTELNGISKTTHDNESAHGTADDILLETLRALGYGEVADAYENAQERIEFWYA